MQIIGWDSAVQEINNGLILSEISDNKLRIKGKWDKRTPLAEILVQWFSHDIQTLLAIDSPLGWPARFAENLVSHKAGKAINVDPTIFFRRQTDLNIQQRFHKVPLEVSADRIARTAFYTLQRIGETSKRSGKKIEVVWNPFSDFKIGMIEVYPWAVLATNFKSTIHYKKKANKPFREILMDELLNEYKAEFQVDIDITSVEHDFDAFLCSLAGYDFMTGKCEPPPLIDETIKTEGWTWIRNC